MKKQAKTPLLAINFCSTGNIYLETAAVKDFFAAKVARLAMKADIGGMAGRPPPFLALLRPHQLPAGLVPAAVGLAYAFYETGRFSALNAAAVLALVALTQLGGTFLDDFFDHQSGVDWQTKNRTPFSGGGGQIQSGRMSPRAVLAWGSAFLLVGSLLASWLAVRLSSPIWGGIYLFGLFSGIFYTAPPLALAYRGWGEVLIAANYGPTAALLGFSSQTGRADGWLVLVSLCFSFLILAVILVHELLDCEADRQAQKKGWVVRWGEARGKKLFQVFLICPPLLLSALLVLRALPAAAALPLGTAAWAAAPLRKLKKNPGGETLATVLKQAFAIYILFGLLLAGGLALSRVG